MDTGLHCGHNVVELFCSNLHIRDSSPAYCSLNVPQACWSHWMDGNRSMRKTGGRFLLPRHFYCYTVSLHIAGRVAGGRGVSWDEVKTVCRSRWLPPEVGCENLFTEIVCVGMWISHTHTSASCVRGAEVQQACLSWGCKACELMSWIFPYSPQCVIHTPTLAVTDSYNASNEHTTSVFLR